MVQHASSRAADPAAAADALRQQIVAENSATAINGQAETADAVYGASTIKRVRRTKSAIATIREAIHVVPSRPTKTTDTRAKKFVGTSVELDAIPVQKLRGLARACIEQHVDQEQLAILKVAETSERENADALGRHCEWGAAMTAPPHTRGECDWCRWPIGEVAEEWNGGRGHPQCIAEVARAVFPDGPGPVYVHRRRFYRADPLIPFCKRLGREAARLGIDMQTLAIAVGRARHGA